MKSSTQEAPFSFHCVICIEPFNLDDRPPVILPCGHTYICEQCSKRLKKCMECRTSLFMKPPVTNNSNTGNGSSTPSSASGWPHLSPSTPISPRNRSTYSTHRERYHHYQSTPSKKPQPVELIPLPIPKNLVMIALMEAAERKRLALMDETYESDAEDCDDTNRVIDGIAALSSNSGTYVVRDNQGLAVFERNPYDSTLQKVPSYLKPPPMLRYGQRVQVVGMENDDVYKLARNEGYIVAQETQLVKVGMPQEKACEVEGMITTIQSSKADLLKQMIALEKAEHNLQMELHKALDKPPQHPIIEDIKPLECIDSEPEENNTDEESELEEILHRKTFEIGLSLSEESLIGTPTPSSPTADAGASSTLSRQVLFLNDEDTAISDTVSESGVMRIHRSDSPLVRGAFICGGSLFPILRSASDEDDESGRRLGHFRPRTNRRSDPEDSLRNPESVDFRTGLSGHIALNCSKRKKKSITHQRKHEGRMMGEHRGIAPIRHMRKPSSIDSPH
jgi:hypothetical protein